jgi:hypothetical protein
MLKMYAIYGASGFGREVMPVARQMLQHGEGQESAPFDLVFVDDNSQERLINGHRVVSFDEYASMKCEEKYIAIAIADSKIRKKLVERCEANSIKSWNIFASNVVVLDRVDIGDGVILCPNVTLTSNIKIGKAFHANIYSYVGHDCMIGDYVTFAPAVKCNGNVRIHDNAYIGTGAIIKQGTPDKPLVIGEGAVIGMGAVVTKDVPAGAVVVGNPAKPLIKR